MTADGPGVELATAWLILILTGRHGQSIVLR